MKLRICIFIGLCITGMLCCKKQNADVKSQFSHVYVAGYETGYGSVINTAEYWRDSTMVTLTDSPVESEATSVAVIGNDVYVAGYRIFYDSLNQGQYYGTLWVNGHPENLGINLPAQYISSYPVAMAVSGTDLYIAGYESDTLNQIAKYWINGSEFSLTNGTSSVANAITISGNDVYIAGSEMSNSGKYVAKYWKNGTQVALTDGNKNASATSITVSGNDVYVCGVEFEGFSQTIVKYWKNGNLVNLTAGTTEVYATGIGVSGTNVYVSGKEYIGGTYYARLWENGLQVSLPYSNSYSWATSVTVSGADLYISGVINNGMNYVPMYWKNSNPVILSSRMGLPETKSIFISDH